MEDNHHCLVVDVGKTNVKIHVLNAAQESLAVHNLDNQIINADPYPHADVDGIWSWILSVFAEVARDYPVSAIAVSTHGATAALVDPAQEGDGLVLPVLDYEWNGVENPEGYAAVRPAFSETFSPQLPAGLNLGRQLYWQQKHFPDDFARARAILLYPQYWAWRLTGNLVSEVTSLGCHTDLWCPEKNEYSSLVKSLEWEGLFPPLARAWQSIGTISEQLGAATGLPSNCRVHAGIHDSNASFVRFLLAMPDEKFCVVSSGTWVVCMVSGGDTEVLDEHKDMLANCDVFGDSIPCGRFMGGREYAEICRLCGAEPDGIADINVVSEIIRADIFALPDFSNGSGPFGFREPEIRGEPENANALASLYCALMVKYCVDLLQVEGSVILVGSYLQNPLLCSLIAQLCDRQVLLSSDTAGTVRGTAQLTDWDHPVSVSLTPCEASDVEGLADYAAKWRHLARGQ